MLLLLLSGVKEDLSQNHEFEGPSRTSIGSVPASARTPGGGWDRLAAEDALFFIDPTLSARLTAEEFIAAGRLPAQRALAFAGELAGRGRMLEIGCGLGRTAVNFAAHFERVDGVDASARMVEAARSRGLPDNVHLHATSGYDVALFADARFDLVFSHLVFQHVADDAVVAAYLRETGRVLRPGGVAVLQFDTRPRRALVSALALLPDALLPRRHRRHMRRIRRDPEQIRAMARAGGLTIETEQGAGSAEHWLRLRRA